MRESRLAGKLPSELVASESNESNEQRLLDASVDLLPGITEDLVPIVCFPILTSLEECLGVFQVLGKATACSPDGTAAGNALAFEQADIAAVQMISSVFAKAIQKDEAARS